MPIALPPLPYPAHALVPFLSERTLLTHHGKHQKAYVETVNRHINGSQLEESGLLRIIRHTAVPELANAAAQAWNHQFFWKCMVPAERRLAKSPSAELKNAITNSFGGEATFEEKFKTEATKLFGSGWLWVALSSTGALEIVSSGNAALDFHRRAPGEHMIPLFVIDVWEHAYYLDYESERGQFVEQFWEHIDWHAANERFAHASLRVDGPTMHAH